MSGYRVGVLGRTVLAIEDFNAKLLRCVRYTMLSSIVSSDLHGATIREIVPDWGKNNEPLRFHKLFDAAFAREEYYLSFVAPVQPFIMNERLAVQQGMFLCPFTLSLRFEQAIVQPASFEFAVDQEAKQIKADFARKFVITKKARCELLRELHRMNITSASLFPGLGGFAQSLKESYEALGDVEPLRKNFELSAIEDFGWSG
jgi:hypothetical protein